MIGIADAVVIFLLVTDSGPNAAFTNLEEEEKRCLESMGILDIARSSSRVGGGERSEWISDRFVRHTNYF